MVREIIPLFDGGRSGSQVVECSLIQMDYGLAEALEWVQGMIER